MDQVLNLDMKEYRLLCEAQELKNIDRQFWIHLQAFVNNKATLRDRKGKLIYGRFEKLFDYEAALSRKDRKKRQEKPMNPRLENMKRFLKLRKGGNTSEQ
ncbi:hypothetical protein [uncultured Faecalibaculum sp.]|uniref:hypothetical protein n=1 Tax=uncultured Faecalibaculum sp. TaxID=1729681 RepID=UPI0025E01544|nr:hypothetical protein [uncultured Faecalibaculum sp.]